jgi:AGZA family xanthine/uracil permease-like MFS transporter
MLKLLEKIFKIRESGSSVKTELVAGLTTFFTMAYIIFVQPAVLSSVGMDFGAVMAATCISAAFASIMMGLYANHPIALAPVMGENFFFAFTVVLALGVKWETALGIVFVSGILFLLMSLFDVRELLINSIPASLKSGITVGIGLFIAFIGLVYAGVVEKSPGGVLKIGHLNKSYVIIALIGLVIISVLKYYNIKGALIIGMVASAVVSIPLGVAEFHGLVSLPPSIEPTFLKMNLADVFTFKHIPIVIVFLFMLMFDTVGTVVGVTEQAGLVDENGNIKRIKRILITDSTATVAGAVLGTSTVSAYIESSAGVNVGGRTGLSAVTTGVLFLAALFFEPLVKMIGGGITVNATVLYPVIAPALIIVGSMMISHLSKIDYSDITEYLPAYLIIIGIPFTYSIADGLAFGFIFYPVLKILTGKIREISKIMIFLGLIFVLRYVFLNY